jgi:hypothetical protein
VFAADSEMTAGTRGRQRAEILKQLHTTLRTLFLIDLGTSWAAGVNPPGTRRVLPTPPKDSSQTDQLIRNTLLWWKFYIPQQRRRWAELYQVACVWGVSKGGDPEAFRYHVTRMARGVSRVEYCPPYLPLED